MLGLLRTFIVILLSSWSRAQQPCSVAQLYNGMNFTVIGRLRHDSKRYAESCPFMHKRFKCKKGVDGKNVFSGGKHAHQRRKARRFQWEVVESRFSCSIQTMTAYDWPLLNRTIWLVCDSLCWQTFISLLCTLEELIDSNNITPLGDVDDVHHRCYGFQNSVGRICLYYLGCFSGKCFQPQCPISFERKTCIEEVADFVHPGDVIFMGIGSHIREDENEKAINELQLFKDVIGRFYGIKIIWLSSPAQHFSALKSGRLNTVNVSQLIKSSGCVPHEEDGKCVTDRYFSSYLKELNVPVLPWYQISREAHRAHYSTRDCTHFCNPGFTDIFADTIMSVVKDSFLGTKP